MTIKDGEHHGDLPRAFHADGRRLERLAGAQICFSGCDDEGWYFVNDQFVGETHDWQAQPIFDIKKFLHAGDNVIAVGVNNGGGQGGLNPNVNVDIIGQARALAVVAQPVQRPGANHRAIHERRR